MSAPDPTDDGAFRYTFLALFDEEDARHLQQAGVILSQAAIAGDPQYDPVGRFEAACRDARALQVYLQEVRDLAREDEGRASQERGRGSPEDQGSRPPR